MTAIVGLALVLMTAAPTSAATDCAAVLARCQETPRRCRAAKLKRCLREGVAACVMVSPPPTMPVDDPPTTTTVPITPGVTTSTVSAAPPTTTTVPASPGVTTTTAISSPTTTTTAASPGVTTTTAISPTTTTVPMPAGHCRFCPTARCEADGVTCTACGGGMVDVDMCSTEPKPACCPPVEPLDCSLATEEELAVFCQHFFPEISGGLPPSAHGCCAEF